MYDFTTLMTNIPTTRRKVEAATISRTTACIRLEAEAYDDFEMDIGQAKMFVWRIIPRRQHRSPDWTPRCRCHASGLEEKHVKLETNDNVGNIASRRRTKRHWMSTTEEPRPLLVSHGMGRGRQGPQARWRSIKHMKLPGNSMHRWAEIANVAGSFTRRQCRVHSTRYGRLAQEIPGGASWLSRSRIPHVLAFC